LSWNNIILLAVVGCVAGRWVKTNQTATAREPSEADIHFMLFTRSGGVDNPVEVELSFANLFLNGYDPADPTIILSHGYSDEGVGFGRRYAEAYFQVGEFNIISINWQKLAAWYDYFGAAVRTRFVGEHTAKLVDVLANNGGIDKLHLIGHSLGAHVVGFIGKKVQEYGHMVPRITGLDPAEPAFDFAGPDARLDKEDATFVDVIHTNSGMLWEGCLSIMKSIGHADFYPAGGKHQPGCTDLCLESMCNINNINDLILGGCSHGRANTYWHESVVATLTGDQFMAWKCESWDLFLAGECCDTSPVPMGYALNSGVEGKYMLYIHDEEPFAYGDVCKQNQ